MTISSIWNMHPSYVVLCLIVYLLHLSAVCQAVAQPIAKRAPAKIFTFDEAAKEWEDFHCGFPDGSWYKQDDEKNPFDSQIPVMLEACQKLENIQTDSDRDIIFKKKFCNTFYHISFFFCKNETLRPFVERCLTPAIFEAFRIDVCLYLSTLDLSDNLTFKKYSTECKRNCENTTDFKDVCKLYGWAIHQYMNINKCLYLNTSKTPKETSIQTTLEKQSPNDAAATDIENKGKSTTFQPITSTQNVTVESNQTSSSTTNVDVKPSEPPSHVINNDRPTQAETIEGSTVEKPSLSHTEKVATAASDESKADESKTSNTPLVNTSISKLTTLPPSKQSDTNLPEADDSGMTTADVDHTEEPESDNIEFNNTINGDDDDDDDDDDDGNRKTETSDGQNDEIENNVETNVKEDGKKTTKGKTNVAVDNDEHENHEIGKGDTDDLAVKADVDENPGSGHFLAYFLTAVIICISGYVIYHNKQKILAFIIEGRNSGRNGRQRSKDVKYTQLKSNVEEVLPSLEQVTTGKNFVY